MAISDLNRGSITLESQIAFYDPASGTEFRGTVAQLAEALKPILSAASLFVTQYAIPTSGQSLAVRPSVVGGNVWLLCTPAAPLAALTLALPPADLCVDGQEVQVYAGQPITALTTTSTGAHVHGAPTSLAVHGFFKLRFGAAFRAWFRGV